MCVRTVYPAQVIGPRDAELSEGNQGLKMLLEQLRIVPSSGGMQAVDVRDLAAIHVALLEAAPKAGRYVAAGHRLSWEETCDLLDRLTGNKTPRIPIDGRLVRWLGWPGDELQRWVDSGMPLSQAKEFNPRRIQYVSKLLLHLGPATWFTIEVDDVDLLNP